MANPQVVVDFVADTKQLSAGFKEAGSASTGFGSKLKGMGRAAVQAAGVAGLAAIGATLKVGVEEWSESQKVMAQTQAVLKSTGASAGVTAKQVAGLAEAIMRKTGIDDEAIQSGENLLLTFTKVQNQAGKGNDIFNQATRIMTDMSVALGQDMKTSAIQLGKALNDPIRGISALRRVGVTFTKAQQEQIKAMVAAGDTMGAQKVILAELNKEFGGSAEAAGKTLPGQVNILRESFSNLAGQLVSTLMPMLQTITELFVKYPGLMKAVVIGVIALSAAMVALNAVMLITAAVTSPITIWFVAIAAAIAAVIVIVVLIIKHWDDLTAVFKKGFNAIKKVASSVLDWLKANWPLIIGIIGGPLATVVVLVIRYWDDIKAAAAAAWNAIKQTISTVLNAIQQLVQSAWNSILNTITTVLEAIRSAVSAVWNAISSNVASVSNAIKATVTTVWNAIKAAMTAAIDAAEASVKASFTAVKNAVTSVVDATEASVKASFNAIKNVITAAIDAAEAAIKASFNAIRQAIQAAQQPISAAVHTIADVLGLPGAAAQAMASTVKAAIDSLIGFLRGAVGTVSGVASSIANAIRAPINAVIGAWNSLSFTVPTVHIPGFKGVKVAGKTVVPGWGGATIGGGSWGFPNIGFLARGGVVDQPTLAVVGEGPGREIVTPEALLRSILAEQRPDVRVYIGDQELRGVIRYEVRTENSRTAQTLLAGLG